MSDPTHPEKEAPAPPDAAGSDEPVAPNAFAKALEDFERGKPPAEAQQRRIAAGMKLRGTLVSISDDQSLLDIGGRSEGVIETRHLRDEAGTVTHRPGDVIELYVVSEDPLTLAPALKADPGAALRQLRESRASGIPVTGRVTGRNSGGLEVDVAGVRGFCPVSQVELGFCADPSPYVGRTLEFLVTEVKHGRRVVLSRRALLKRATEEQARRLLASIKPGDELDATVARLEPFGAFVDLGGVDGLVHVSEIRHERIGHPRVAVAVGDRVRVRVLRLEQGKDGKQRIALSIKAAAPDPWQAIEERFPKGARVQGTVVRVTDFGAFVNLAPGIDGLVHVSEAAAHPVAHVKEVLAPQQTVEAVVLAADAAKRRISLSIREAVVPPAEAPRAPAVADVVEGFVAGIKPFGLFVDLPAYGRRVRGLIPREETGAPREADLAKRFAAGDPVEVEVLEVREGKIRLRLREVKERGEARPRDRAEEQPRGDRPAGRAAPPSRPPEEPTTMALALRKALEKAKEKRRRS